MLAQPGIRLYRRATAACFVLGPVLLLADNLIHPTEFTRDHEARQLAEIAGSYTRWQLAHALGFLSIIVIAGATLGLSFMVRRRWFRAGLIGGVLGLVGLLGFASVVTIDGYTWGVLGEVSAKPNVDAATIELALHDVQGSNWSLVYYLPPVLWITGMVVLAFTAVRRRALPWPAGTLLIVGSLMVGTEAAITDNTYFVAGSSVMLAAGLAVGAAIARMSDESFAAA